ncbi:MAG: SCO family protein [Proteobacteria bacterium]|nr:SCO family protein [Pseudomonadota bacterium]MBS0462248.1 SCO family protein [Pseudomonadota bacterium]MBS0465356.1 SCO family protein [Pseudomonadota bacterium]
MIARWLAFALSALLGAAPAATPLPGDSVLQPTQVFTDQSGHDFHLADRAGQVQMVSMFYASCTYTCPLTIDAGRGIDQALTPAERTRLRVLMVSFDVRRDTPAALAALAGKRKLDPSRWTLARGSDDGVRTFAALLGIRYRRLANGDFDHSSQWILLDAQGRILARSEVEGAKRDRQFLAAVRKALATPAAATH